MTYFLFLADEERREEEELRILVVRWSLLWMILSWLRAIWILDYEFIRITSDFSFHRNLSKPKPTIFICLKISLCLCVDCLKHRLLCMIFVNLAVKLWGVVYNKQRTNKHTNKVKGEVNEPKGCQEWQLNKNGKFQSSIKFPLLTWDCANNVNFSIWWKHKTMKIWGLLAMLLGKFSLSQFWLLLVGWSAKHWG